MMQIPIQSLPDSDKKQILMANEQVLENQPDLAILMLYSELRNVSVEMDRNVSVELERNFSVKLDRNAYVNLDRITVLDISKILSKILVRSSDFYKSIIVVARII